MVTQKIFLQSHLDISEDIKYKKGITELFGDNDINYEIININVPTNLKNIHKLSRFMNEYCLYYYVYENKLYKDFDIVSFGTYRRIPNIYNILVEKIMNENYVQYYETFIFQYNSYRSTVNIEDLYKYYNDFFYLYQYFKSMGYPDFILEDLIGYLNYQKYYNIDKIKESLKAKFNHIFYSRSLISLRSSNFEKMMMFVQGFFRYISNKYKFNIYNYDELKKWYINYIIEPIRKNSEDLLLKFHNNPLIEPRNRLLLFNTLEQHNKIFDKSEDYGLNSYCNYYRYFGYIFEYLVNLFIDLSPNKYYNMDLKNYVLGDIEIYSNR